LGPRKELIGGSIGVAKGFFPLPDGQRWCGRMGVHVPDSRRKLKTAILESTAVKVRKVWRPGRRILECQRLPLSPAQLGNEAEVSRLADEVAKRGRKGQHNPAGARTSRLRVVYLSRGRRAIRVKSDDLDVI